MIRKASICDLNAAVFDECQLCRFEFTCNNNAAAEVTKSNDVP
jgi:hypothetical protein